MKFPVSINGQVIQGVIDCGINFNLNADERRVGQRRIKNQVHFYPRSHFHWMMRKRKLRRRLK